MRWSTRRSRRWHWRRERDRPVASVVMATVTVLGGGQLGRMLGLAGIPLGLSFRFLDPSDVAPARAVGDVVVGALDDIASATRAAEGARVVTYEWEAVPASTARALEHLCPVLPPALALEVSQDRVLEKERFESLGITTAAFRSVDDQDSLHEAVDVVGLPAVLKTRRGGYDGKGQAILRDAFDVDAAWERLGDQPLILEAFVEFRRELSIVGVRGRDGTTLCWPVVENQHVDGILRMTRAPAPGWNEELQARAEGCLAPLFESLDYVGV